MGRIQCSHRWHRSRFQRRRPRYTSMYSFSLHLRRKRCVTTTDVHLLLYNMKNSIQYKLLFKRTALLFSTAAIRGEEAIYGKDNRCARHRLLQSFYCDWPIFSPRISSSSKRASNHPWPPSYLLYQDIPGLVDKFLESHEKSELIEETKLLSKNSLN